MSLSHAADRSLLEQRARLIVLGLLIPLHACLLLWIACRSSPTSDEIAHLAAGVRIWTEGKIDLYLVNPPLVKAIAALPVVLDQPVTDWRRADLPPETRPEWNIGQDYIAANGPRARWHFLIARCACVPFGLLGLWCCWRWGLALFGPQAGVLAALQWCFSPNILGNGALITPDVPAAALGLTALFAFRNWIITGTWQQAFLAGIWLGLAQLTKFTWLLLYGLLPILWLACEFLMHRRRPSAGQFAQLAFLLSVSLDVIQLGYGFQGTFQPLGDSRFSSQAFAGSLESGCSTGNRFSATLLAAAPAPLPPAFLRGLDLQRRDFEGGWRPLPSYLRGEQRQGGWWYYYLYGLLVKVPVGMWLVAIVGLLGRPWKRIVPGLRPSAELLIVVLPAIALFVLVSSHTSFTRSQRYVIPCFPLGYVLFASAWSAGSSRTIRILALLGIIAAAWESLAAWPRSLSFFNIAVGGSTEGRWHLLDANLDWGQDLYSLKDWQRQHPQASPLHLAYAGVADPTHFDINALPIPGSIDGDVPPLTAGWYAVSVNHVHGYDHEQAPWRYFLKLTPVDRAGDSILIFRIEESP